MNHRNLSFALYYLTILLWTITLPSIVEADSGDLLSHFQPYISVQEEYNSNLYLTADHRIHDYITSVIPGLRFSTLPRSETTGEFQPAIASPGTKYGVDLDYNVPLVYYARESHNNYVGVGGTLNAWYFFDPNLTFRVRNYSIRSQEPREQEYSSTALPGELLSSTERGRRPTYFRNVFGPSVEYRFGREDVFSIYYQNNIYRNEDPLFQDSMENFINPKLTYWFDIRNGVSLEYALTLGDFERSADLTGHMATGRYIHRFNPMTSVFGEYTHLWRNFDSPSSDVSPSVDYVIYRPSIGIEHAFSPTLTGSVKVGYFWVRPEEGDTIGRPYYEVHLTQLAPKSSYSLSFLGGYREDFFTAENLGFIQYHRAFGTITYELLPRMTVGLFGSYEWAKFERPSAARREVDNIWGTGINASYQLFRWLNLSVLGSYRENHSNIETEGYKEYRGIFKATVMY